MQHYQVCLATRRQIAAQQSVMADGNCLPSFNKTRSGVVSRAKCHTEKRLGDIENLDSPRTALYASLSLISPCTIQVCVSETELSGTKKTPWLTVTCCPDVFEGNYWKVRSISRSYFCSVSRSSARTSPTWARPSSCQVHCQLCVIFPHWCSLRFRHVSWPLINPSVSCEIKLANLCSRVQAIVCEDKTKKS